MTDPVEIYVLNKTVRLLQPADGFRTSLDSVMLAAACPVEKGQDILDMGCGVGGAGFCLLQRVPGTKMTGIDIQSACIDLAQRNSALNNAEDHTIFITSDIRNYDVDTPDSRFDHAICNPPYMAAGQYTQSLHEGKAIARGHNETNMGVKDWIDAGFKLLKSGGSLTMIHRADATDRIIQALGKRFGAIEIIPLWPRKGQPAKRVIIRAVKDRKSPAKIHSGIILHNADGEYTEESDTILRDAQKI